MSYFIGSLNTLHLSILQRAPSPFSNGIGGDSDGVLEVKSEGSDDNTPDNTPGNTLHDILLQANEQEIQDSQDSQDLTTDSQDLTVAQSLEASQKSENQSATTDESDVRTFVFDDGVSLSSARFIRDGNDLTVENIDGRTFVVKGYFSDSSPPELVDSSGVPFPYDLVLAFLEIRSGSDPQLANTQTPPQVVGVVGLIEGKAYVIRDKQSPELLKAGDPIYENDVIEVPIEGLARLDMNDESVLSVSEGGRVSIDEFLSAVDDREGSTVLSIIKGKLLYLSGKIAANDYESVEIRSPVNTIAVRGTAFGLDIDPTLAQDQVKVSLLSGSVSVRDADEAVILDDPFSSAIMGYANQQNNTITKSAQSEPVSVLQTFGRSLNSLSGKQLGKIQSQIEEQQGGNFDLQNTIDQVIPKKTAGAQGDDDAEGQSSSEDPHQQKTLKPKAVQTKSTSESSDDVADTTPRAVIKNNVISAPPESSEGSSPPYFLKNAPKFVDVDENTLATVGKFPAFTGEGSSDGDSSVKYRLVGPDADFFTIDANGTVRLSTQLDAERPVSSDPAGSYRFSVRAENSYGQQSDHQVVLNVRDINDEAPSVKDDINVSVKEGQATQDVLGQIDGVEDIDSDISSLVFRKLGKENIFSISADGSITFSGGDKFVDFESQSVIKIPVVIDDGINRGLAEVKVNVINVDDEAPVSPSKVETTVLESAFGGQALLKIIAGDVDSPLTNLTYTLDAESRKIFDIDNQGIISLKKDVSLNAEAKSSYAITAVVTDGGGQTSATAILLNVADVNDTPPYAPTFSFDGVISEDNKDFVKAKIESPSSATLSVNEKFSSDGAHSRLLELSSQDDDQNSQFTYTLENNPYGYFFVEYSDGRAYLSLNKGVTLDYETLGNEVLKVVVSGSDGKNKSVGDATLLVQVIDYDDTAPVIRVLDSYNVPIAGAKDGAFVDVLESILPGQKIAQGNAVDSENSPVTYSLENDHGGLFSIDSTSGIISLSEGQSLDVDVRDGVVPQTLYDLSVVATDANGNSAASDPITVKVVGVDDEAPFDIGVVPFKSMSLINEGTISIEESLLGGSRIAVINGRDIDSIAQDISYRVLDQNGRVSDLFEVVDQKYIALKSQTNLDLDTPHAIDQYPIILEARDAKGNTSEHLSLSVKVTEVDDVRFSISAVDEVTVSENVAQGDEIFRFTVSDKDTDLRLFDNKNIDLNDVFSIALLSDDSFVNTDWFAIVLVPLDDTENPAYQRSFKVVTTDKANIDFESNPQLDIVIRTKNVTVNAENGETIIDSNFGESHATRLILTNAADESPTDIKVSTDVLVDRFEEGVFVLKFSATDPDADSLIKENISFNIVSVKGYKGDSSGSIDISDNFDINASNELVLKNSSKDNDLSDLNGIVNFDVTVIAEDATGEASSPKTFRIKVDNLDDIDPTIGDFVSIDENGNDIVTTNSRSVVLDEGVYEDGYLFARGSINGLHGASDVKLFLGNFESLFEVKLSNDSTGYEVYVRPGVTIDYEQREKISLSVTAVIEGKSISIEMPIRVIDKDDTAPSLPKIQSLAGVNISTDAISVIESTRVGSKLAKLEALDPDTPVSGVTYRILEKDPNSINDYVESKHFETDGRFVVLKSPVDYETQGEKGINIYIEAVDGEGNTSKMKKVSVSVIDINDTAPRFGNIVVPSYDNGNVVVEKGADETGYDYVVKVSENLEYDRSVLDIKVFDGDKPGQEKQANIVVSSDERFHGVWNTTKNVWEIHLRRGETLDFDTNKDKFGTVLKVQAFDGLLWSSPIVIKLNTQDVNDNSPTGILLNGKAIESPQDSAGTVAEDAAQDNTKKVSQLSVIDLDTIDISARTLKIKSVKTLNADDVTDQGLFVIDKTVNGKAWLNVAQGSDLDYETLGAKLLVTVEGSDGKNSVEKTFTVDIANIDDTPPVITTITAAGSGSKAVSADDSGIFVVNNIASVVSESDLVLASIVSHDDDAKDKKTSGFNFTYGINDKSGLLNVNANGDISLNTSNTNFVSKVGKSYNINFNELVKQGLAKNIPVNKNDPNGLARTEISVDVTVTSRPTDDNDIIVPKSAKSSSVHSVVLSFDPYPSAPPEFQIQDFVGKNIVDAGTISLPYIPETLPADKSLLKDTPLARVIDTDVNAQFDISVGVKAVNKDSKEEISSIKLSYESGLVLLEKDSTLPASIDANDIQLQVSATYRVNGVETILKTTKDFAVSVAPADQQTNMSDIVKFTPGYDGVVFDKNIELSVSSDKIEITVKEGTSLDSLQKLATDESFVKIGTLTLDNPGGTSGAGLVDTSREGIFVVTKDGGLYINKKAVADIDKGIYAQGSEYSSKVRLVGDYQPSTQNNVSNQISISLKVRDDISDNPTTVTINGVENAALSVRENFLNSLINAYDQEVTSFDGKRAITKKSFGTLDVDESNQGKDLNYFIDKVTAKDLDGNDISLTKEQIDLLSQTLSVDPSTGEIVISNTPFKFEAQARDGVDVYSFDYGGKGEAPRFDELKDVFDADKYKFLSIKFGVYDRGEKQVLDDAYTSLTFNLIPSIDGIDVEDFNDNSTNPSWGNPASLVFVVTSKDVSTLGSNSPDTSDKSAVFSVVLNEKTGGVFPINGESVGVEKLFSVVNEQGQSQTYYQVIPTSDFLKNTIALSDLVITAYSPDGFESGVVTFKNIPAPSSNNAQTKPLTHSEVKAAAAPGTVVPNKADNVSYKDVDSIWQVNPKSDYSSYENFNPVGDSVPDTDITIGEALLDKIDKSKSAQTLTLADIRVHKVEKGVSDLGSYIEPSSPKILEVTEFSRGQTGKTIDPSVFTVSSKNNKKISLNLFDDGKVTSSDFAGKTFVVKVEVTPENVKFGSTSTFDPPLVKEIVVSFVDDYNLKIVNTGSNIFAVPQINEKDTADSILVGKFVVEGVRDSSDLSVILDAQTQKNFTSKISSDSQGKTEISFYSTAEILLQSGYALNVSGYVRVNTPNTKNDVAQQSFHYAVDVAESVEYEGSIRFVVDNDQVNNRAVAKKAGLAVLGDSDVEIRETFAADQNNDEWLGRFHLDVDQKTSSSVYTPSLSQLKLKVTDDKGNDVSDRFSIKKSGVANDYDLHLKQGNTFDIDNGGSLSYEVTLEVDSLVKIQGNAAKIYTHTININVQPVDDEEAVVTFEENSFSYNVVSQTAEFVVNVADVDSGSPDNYGTIFNLPEGAKIINTEVVAGSVSQKDNQGSKSIKVTVGGKEWIAQALQDGSFDVDVNVHYKNNEPTVTKSVKVSTAPEASQAPSLLHTDSQGSRPETSMIDFGDISSGEGKESSSSYNTEDENTYANTHDDASDQNIPDPSI